MRRQWIKLLTLLFCILSFWYPNIYHFILYYQIVYTFISTPAFGLSSDSNFGPCQVIIVILFTISINSVHISCPWVFFFFWIDKICSASKGGGGGVVQKSGVDNNYHNGAIESNIVPQKVLWGLCACSGNTVRVRPPQIQNIKEGK